MFLGFGEKGDDMRKKLKEEKCESVIIWFLKEERVCAGFGCDLLTKLMTRGILELIDFGSNSCRV